MAFKLKDRTRDTSTTTGTGPFTVSGAAPTAFQTFSAQYSVGDTFWGTIANQGANEWETGLFTYSAANQITTTAIYESSNAGAAVTFSAGTKDIWVDLPATGFRSYNMSPIQSACGGL